MLPTMNLFGKSTPLYGPINVIAYLAAVLLLFIHVKEYRSFCTFPPIVSKKFFKKRTDDSRRVDFLAFVEAALIFALTVAVVFPFNAPLSQLFLGDTSEGYFPIIYFVPIALFVFGVLFRLTPLRLLDYAAPVECLLLILVKIACYCAGCCYGIELPSSPFFNQTNHRHELPIQLIEVAIAVVMFVVLSFMRKKRKRAGFMFPAFIVMYCATRFVFEFWRDDYPRTYSGMNGNQLMSLIGLALGVIYLIVVFVWGARITAFFDTRNKAYAEKKLQEIKKQQKSTSAKKHSGNKRK